MVEIIKGVQNVPKGQHEGSGMNENPEILAENAEEPPKKFAKQKMAIALGYDAGADEAPKVMAKGQGFLAEQIIQIALANGVEIKEDADLAMVLSTLEVDMTIPVEVFAAVAEILSYVYKVNAEKRDRFLQSKLKD